jgi:hypothetical protein
MSGIRFVLRCCVLLAVMAFVGACGGDEADSNGAGADGGAPEGLTDLTDEEEAFVEEIEADEEALDAATSDALHTVGDGFFDAPLHDVSAPAPATAELELADGRSITLEGITCEIDVDGDEPGVSINTMDEPIDDVGLHVWREGDPVGGQAFGGETYDTEGLSLYLGYEPGADADEISVVQLERVDGERVNSLGSGEPPIVRYADGVITAEGELRALDGDAGGEFTFAATCD